MAKAPWYTHAALLLVSALYGFNYINAKWLLPTYIGVFAFVLLRLAIATGLFFAQAKWQGLSLAIEPRDIGRFLVCAVCGASINMVVFFQGLTMTSPVNASIIMTSAPIFTVLVSLLLTRERVKKRTVLGIALGCIGAVVLVYRPELKLGGRGLYGDLLVLSNAVLYATYLVVVKKLVEKYGTLRTVSWMFLLGGLIALPFCIGDFLRTDWAGFDWLAVALAAYIIVGVTFVVYQLNATAMKYVSSAVVGFYIYLQPAFATAFALALGMEQPGWKQGVAALFIFAGVYLVVSKPRRQRRASSD